MTWRGGLNLGNKPEDRNDAPQTKILSFILLGLVLIALILILYRLGTAYKPAPICWIHGFDQSYGSLGKDDSSLPDEI